jgi:putative membrane protein
MAERSSSGPSDYLAAERTFLAWIRTGLALMGFGFVVARFGLFLQALRMGQPNGLGQPSGVGQAHLAAHAYGSSFWLGTALIAVGVIVNVVSARNHVRLVRELNRGGTGYARPSSLAIAVAVTLAVMGLVMSIYLVAVR